MKKYFHVMMMEIFLKSIKLYADLYPSDKIICTWDKKMHLDEGKNFRQELCEYKQGRDENYNKKVYEHTDDINRFLLSLGIKIMEIFLKSILKNFLDMSNYQFMMIST